MTTQTLIRAGLLALMPVALGSLPGLSVANPPSATGSGKFNVNGMERTFSFSAIQQPKGTVAGQAELHNSATGTVLHMDIDCLLFVAPNRVVVSGTITKSNVPGTEGMTGTFEAVDNGDGSKSPPDELSQLAVGGGNCQSPFSQGTIPIQEGTIQVRPQEDSPSHPFFRSR
jgi:hypothetical protein